MLVKCKQCNSPIRNAKTGTICTNCGSTVTFTDIMESVKSVRMGKAHGYVRHYQISKDGGIEKCQFPTTHKGRKRFVARRRGK